MSILFERESPLFSAILKEDDADDILNGGLESSSADYNGGANDAGDNPNNTAADTDANTDNPDNAADETKVDSKEAEDDDDKSGNDLDVDASLNGIDDNDDNSEGGDDSGSNTSAPSTSSDTTSDAEPVKKNTDIFDSLTAEEQAIKIKEQKHQFFKLFTSCNDIMSKISNIEIDNINITVISKVTKSLASLKEYLNDYITYSFDQKSYIENDIVLDRFILTFNSISTILDSIKLPEYAQNGSKK